MYSSVLVSGVPGAGTTRVCEQARRLLGEEYTLLHVGDVMLQEALEGGIATDRTELSQLGLRDQRALRRRATEQIARELDAGPAIVNTHFVVETTTGYIPGLTDESLVDLDPAAFVVVDASDATIQARREESSRSYETFTPGPGFHRQLQSVAAFSYARRTGAPIHHVRNEEDAAADERLAAVAEALL